jgi:hypothetical protein
VRRKKIPACGRALGTTPLSMLLFAPLIGLGYLAGYHFAGLAKTLSKIYAK